LAVICVTFAPAGYVAFELTTCRHSNISGYDHGRGSILNAAYQEFPSKREIKLAQKSTLQEYKRSQQCKAIARGEEPPQHVDAGGIWMMINALWIPDSVVELQTRLCVEAHCRPAGHRTYEATLGALKECVALTTMQKDVKVFVQNYLHFVARIPKDKLLRPPGTQRHATKPNEIQHFDSLYIWVVKR
jgi:hypothetical protein